MSDWLLKACDIETRKYRIKNKFLILIVKKTEEMGRERGESPHKMKKRRDGNMCDCNVEILSFKLYGELRLVLNTWKLTGSSLSVGNL